MGPHLREKQSSKYDEVAVARIGTKGEARIK